MPVTSSPDRFRDAHLYRSGVFEHDAVPTGAPGATAAREDAGRTVRLPQGASFLAGLPMARVVSPVAADSGARWPRPTATPPPTGRRAPSSRSDYVGRGGVRPGDAARVSGLPAFDGAEGTYSTGSRPVRTGPADGERTLQPITASGFHQGGRRRVTPPAAPRYRAAAAGQARRSRRNVARNRLAPGTADPGIDG